MYGGGFATVPAYLADLFGTQMVGAIHGRLLTAWSTAGILGPVLVNYIREYQIAHGVPKAQAYDMTMYILAGMLAVGFVCNLLVRPLADHWFMTPAELADEKRLAHEVVAASGAAPSVASAAPRAGWPWVVLAWAVVAVPLAWGAYRTAASAGQFFR